MQLSKEKRDRLLMVGVLTVLVCFALWWSFINPSNKALSKSQAQIAELNASIDQASRWLKRESAWAEDYEQARARKAAKEKDMLPEGKEMSFLSDAIERVRQNHAVRFESISPPVHSERVELLPNFIDPGSANVPVEWIVYGGRVALLPEYPYRRNATLSYRCFGYYHDFGAFLADLENTYPYMQFQVNLIQPMRPAEQRVKGEDDLRFELKVVALLQPPPPK